MKWNVIIFVRDLISQCAKFSGKREAQRSIPKCIVYPVGAANVWLLLLWAKDNTGIVYHTRKTRTLIKFSAWHNQREFKALTVVWGQGKRGRKERKKKRDLALVGSCTRYDNHVFPNQTIFVPARNDVTHGNSTTLEGSGSSVGTGEWPQVAI